MRAKRFLGFVTFLVVLSEVHCPMWSKASPTTSPFMLREGSAR